MSERTLVLIVASNWRQAKLACEKLDLPRPNYGPNDGNVTTMYVGPNDWHRICGLLPDRLVQVDPPLVGDEEFTRLMEVRREARRRFARRNAGSLEPREIEYVTT